MDADGYPTDEELAAIEGWDFRDLRGLLAYVKERWHQAEWGWSERDGRDYRGGRDYREYLVSTGGWSGNESIISALERNQTFWALCWYSSRRGGHYEFHVSHKWLNPTHG